MTPAPRSNLLRALLLGTTLGAALGALYLAVQAVLGLRLDCEGLGSNECALLSEAATALARYQAAGALGLALVSLGAFLFLRPRRTHLA